MPACTGCNSATMMRSLPRNLLRRGNCSMTPAEPNHSDVEFLTYDEFIEFGGGPVDDPEGVKRLNAKRRDPLALRRIDHVRFFVGNARQSAYFYRNAFGFDVVAYAGL